MFFFTHSSVMESSWSLGGFHGLKDAANVNTPSYCDKLLFSIRLVDWIFFSLLEDAGETKSYNFKSIVL